MGAELAALLVEELHADAAIAWLPSVHDAVPQARDVSVAGPLCAQADAACIATALGRDDLASYFAGAGARLVMAVEHPPLIGHVAAAWTTEPAGDVDPRATLEHMAAMAAAVLALGQAEDQITALGHALGEAENQIARTRRARVVGELASGIVHDFNNCLTTILGYTELALGPLDESSPCLSDLTTIRMAAMDAATLVRRLQTVGRRTQDEDREVADLQDIAKAMPELVRPRWMRRAQVDGVSFDVVVQAQPAPPVHVIVGEIRELLINLLFNAIDAMPTGGRILITTGFADGFAEIAVQDEGIGMSEELQASLFQPFTTTKGARGSGLGLSVCRSIAQRHGGTLSVRSAPGCGSTFVLRLPPAPDHMLEPAMSGERAAAQAARLEPAIRPAGAAIGRRVLLVDDQEEVRGSVGDMLRALGHSVTMASDGNAALELATQQAPDVVFTDFGMPGMNGVELGSHLLTVAPGVPVVLISGWGLDHDVRLSENVVQVLQKPLTMKTLEAALSYDGVFSGEGSVKAGAPMYGT
jgi:signal transduction histidine kinase/CheY-like chemotaxis protein